MSESSPPVSADLSSPAAVQKPQKIGGPPFIGALGLFCAAMIAYWPALHGDLLWDDPAHLTTKALRSLQGLWKIWFHLGATAQYYPLLHSAFWLEHHLWGDATFGYHVWNVLLHSLAAYLVVRIVRRLELPGAWLAGFVFALHPVCVESVAWMTEQKSTLSGVFYLASALLYLDYYQSRRRTQYYLALAFFVMALLSKSVTATLPAVLLVILWWQKGRLDWRHDIRPLSGWLVLGAGSGFFTAWVEKRFIGAQGADYSLTILQHVLLAGRVVWFYAGKVVWPANLIFSYPHWNLDPHEAWQYLYPAALLAVATAFVLLARRHRGPLAALAIFVGTLTPVLGFMNVFPFRYSYVADHFQYLACLAIVVPICAALAGAVSRASLPRQAGAGLAVLLAIGLGFLSWRQAHNYTDPETLFRSVLQRNSASLLAGPNLCAFLSQQPGRTIDAMTVCEDALARHPDRPEPHISMALLQEHLPAGMPEALVELHTALRLWPDDALAHFDLGMALARMGQFSEAVEEYHAVLRILPEDTQTITALGVALLAIPGRQNEAMAAFENVLRIQPCDADALFGEGQVFFQSPGHSFDALEKFEAARACEPDYEPARKMIQQMQLGR